MTNSNKVGIIRNALSRAKYRKTKTRKGGFWNYVRNIDSTSSVYGEPFKIEIDNKCETAYWTLENHNGRDVHKIGIGIKLFDMIKHPVCKSFKLCSDFVLNVFRHEIGHALFTTRDKSFPQILANEGIPFGLFNLFEDCRIEYNLTLKFPQYGKFFWYKFIDLLKPKTPSESLLDMKNKEAGIRIQNSKGNSYIRYCLAPSHAKKLSVSKYRKLISTFYADIINAKTSEDLIPLLKEWINFFGKEIPRKYVKEFSVLGETDPNADETEIDEVLNPSTNVDPVTRCSWDDVSHSALTVENENIKLTKRIKDVLKPIVRNASNTGERVSMSGRKLHIRNAMLRLENCFRNRNKENGKRKIIMFVDYSGSMYDTLKHHGGREFIGAFKMLHDENLIDLKLIYSKDSDGFDMTNRSLKEILSISPNGGHEALEDNLKNYIQDVKKADAVLLFTDGMLTGNMINEYEYRQSGIDLIALCIPRPIDVSQVRKACNGYFSKTFIDLEPLPLAKRILKHIISS